MATYNRFSTLSFGALILIIWIVIQFDMWHDAPIGIQFLKSYLDNSYATFR
jgi:hypothetical protein